MTTDKTQAAIDTINEVLAICKQENPSKFANAPTANQYNISEIFDYLTKE